MTEAKGKFRIFPAAEWQARHDAVHAAMAEQGFDAMLVTSPENIYYLIGLSHHGYFAFTMLLLRPGEPPLLATRSMERATVAEQAPDVVHRGFGDEEEPAEAVVRILRGEGLEGMRVGVGRNNMFFPPVIWDAMREELPEVEWADSRAVVDDVRFIKSPKEQEYIRRAARLSEIGLEAGLEAAAVGVNEQEVVAEVYRAMIAGGSEYPGFVPLVRSADAILQEHSTWQDRRLREGDSLFLELSGAVARYHAPLSRLCYVGLPPEGARESFAVAKAGFETVLEVLRPGATAGDVYAAWQAVVDDGLGHSRYRRHHCGYTVGIGFPPSWVGGSRVVGLRPGSPIEIREGMVFHILSWLIGTSVTDQVLSGTAIVGAQRAEPLTPLPDDITVR